MNVATENALYARFLRGLAVSAGRPAVRVGAETITYEAAHEKALQWAGSLLAGSDEPPGAVGVLAGRGIDTYVAILAGLYAGVTVVPLHADFPAARTQRMLEAAGVSALLADGQGLATLSELSGPWPEVPVLPIGGADGGPFRTVPISPADSSASHGPSRRPTSRMCCSPRVRRAVPRACRSRTAAPITTSGCWTSATTSPPTTSSPRPST